MSKSDNLENVAGDFIGGLSCPMDKSDAEIAIVETIFNAMTEAELENLDQLSEFDEDMSKLQKFTLAEMFAAVASRVGLEDSAANYISIDETDNSTVRELEDAGLPSFARLVTIARVKHGL